MSATGVARKVSGALTNRRSRLVGLGEDLRCGPPGSGADSTRGGVPLLPARGELVTLEKESYVSWLRRGLVLDLLEDEVQQGAGDGVDLRKFSTYGTDLVHHDGQGKLPFR